VIRQCADRVRFPVVADEIQSGLGRTGEFLQRIAAAVRHRDRNPARSGRQADAP